MDERKLLDEQLAYYRARASEYDQWFLRQGRYDYGPEHRAEWLREVATVEAALLPVVNQKEVLELACGTGLWTRHLAEVSARTVALDASPEVIALNKERVRSPNVEHRVADIFSWRPDATFDVVFFSFWLSHVPPRRFDTYWATVRRARKPRGCAFFVDSLFEQSSTARDHAPIDRSGIARRKLNDGREFRIVKLFYEPSVLELRLSESGWRGWVKSTGKFFVYGAVTPV